MSTCQETSMMARWAGRAALLALVMAVTVVSAAAETLMMPKRDARMGKPVVVWGITTQASGATCSLDFGDATTPQNCTGADRSYKAYTHTYATGGTFTATLTVGSESSTVQIRVFDVALLPGGATGDANRGLGINMAIQDGLRYMWYNHATRTSFDTNTQAYWSGHSSETALVALAFQNHGYNLPNNATAPTGLYEKYVVRRALNHVIANLSTITITNQAAGDPRAAGLGVAALDSTALKAPYPEGYTSAIAMLPFAGSGALNRVNTEVAGYTNGKTFGEILQRITNGLAFGQLDASFGAHARGSWFYSYNGGYHDGSTVGWDILGFLAAEAAGATVPAFVKSEFQFTLNCHIKPDGSWNYGHYQTCTNTTSDYPTTEKGGIPLQGMAWTGNSTQAPAVINWINSNWTGGPTWSCPANYGCGYAMFNNFKGLKLQGVTTLSNVNRSTRAWKFLGTTGVEDDWYADYQDYLVYTQSNPPTSTTGGNWPGMQLASGLTGGWGSAMAELILSPVALVLPDADKFGAFGLSPAIYTALEQTSHTVTAKAESSGNTPVPGATVNFTVLTGPNAGLTGTGTTNSSGEATFTYTDAGPVGTVGVDRIQASIGTLLSNIVDMTWTPLNRPPNAVDDSGSTFSGTPVTVSVLVNDGDPDFDLLTITSVTQGADGSVVNNGDGTVTYSPVAGFAGTDTFTYTISDGKGGTDTATVTIDVAKRLATVTAGGGTKVYGSADPAFTPSSAGFLPADGITVTQTARDAGETVGSYPTHATAAGATLANYAVTYTDGALTITKATPTAATTGGTFTYDGQAHASTCTVTGVGTDVLTGVVSYDPGPGVPTTQGTYAVSCEYVATDNYEAASASATITINKAVATVTAGGGTKVYGTVDPAFTPSSTGFLAADGITVTQTARDAGETVGAYATHAAAAGAALGNYAVTYTNGSLSITVAALTVTTNSYTRSYLAADPVFAGTLTGVVAGDGITVAYSSTGAGSQVPGTYPIVPTLVDPNGTLGNYAVSSTGGTLTITNAAPVCTIAPSQASIWPPNHKLVSITASGATDLDGGPLTYSVVSIFQDEPTNTTGDGNTAIDGYGVGTGTAQVRAERVGDPKTPGNGRVYHITFSVTDSGGLSCQATVQVGVPHDQSGKVQPIDGGPIYNSTVAGPAPAVAAKGKGD